MSASLPSGISICRVKQAVGARCRERGQACLGGEGVVRGMEAVGPQVNTGIAIVARTGEALQQINPATIVALSNVSEVSTATQEQS